MNDETEEAERRREALEYMVEALEWIEVETTLFRRGTKSRRHFSAAIQAYATSALAKAERAGLIYRDEIEEDFD